MTWVWLHRMVPFLGPISIMGMWEALISQTSSSSRTKWIVVRRYTISTMAWIQTERHATLDRATDRSWQWTAQAVHLLTTLQEWASARPPLKAEKLLGMPRLRQKQVSLTTCSEGLSLWKPKDRYLALSNTGLLPSVVFPEWTSDKQSISTTTLETLPSTLQATRVRECIQLRPPKSNSIWIKAPLTSVLIIPVHQKGTVKEQLAPRTKIATMACTLTTRLQ